MIRTTRSFSLIARITLVFLSLALSIYVTAAPANASLMAISATPVATITQLQSYASLADSSFPTLPVPQSNAIRIVIAQNEIPDVLVPSVVPPAEPTLDQGTPTPRPSVATTKASNNATLSNAGAGLDIGRIVGSISPLFIVALVPLLFVIGALFYYFFIGDQYRGAPEEDQEVEAEASAADEYKGWREL